MDSRHREPSTGRSVRASLVAIVSALLGASLALYGVSPNFNLSVAALPVAALTTASSSCASHELLQKLEFLGTKFRMRHVQDEHDPAAVRLLEDLVLVRVVDFDAPVLLPGDQLVVDTKVDIAFGHFDSQVVAHAGV